MRREMLTLDMFLYIVNGSFALWTQVGGFQNCPLHIVSVASHVSKHRVFLFSHSRPPSLLYDPNMSVCFLGCVLGFDFVSGSVWSWFRALSMLKF